MGWGSSIHVGPREVWRDLATGTRSILAGLLAVLAVALPAGASGRIAGTHGLKVFSRLTGTPSLNNTEAVYDIGGTDLGIPVAHDGKIYFLFGDTFSGEDPAAGGNWRRNTVAWSTDATFSNGIVFDGFAVSPTTGHAKQTLASNDPAGSGVITNIPTGGISVNGSLYAWFMNVTQWGPAGGEWYISQAELAKWNDASKAFDMVSGCVFPGTSNFGMVAARAGVGGDPHIYLWGTPAGRFGGGVKLARFLPSQIESRGAYQYYDGSVGGIAQWTASESAADYVITGPIGETSVIYNLAVGAWTMLYFSEINDRFEIRQADAPWGPWSAPTTVMTASQCPSGSYGLYAPYMLPQWVENNGGTIYFTMSLWWPYDVCMAKVVLDIGPDGAVSINSGADYTKTASVLLTLSATDDSGSVSQMRISNDGVFDSEPWESYATQKSWTLTGGDGAKTVSVRFRDAGGFESETVTDTICLDTTPPALAFVSVSPAVAAAGDAVHVVVQATDVAGVESVTADSVPLINSGPGVWEGDLVASPVNGSHAVAVQAVDVAGNSASSAGGYATWPTVGASGRSLRDRSAADGASWLLYKVWGIVTPIDADHCWLDDGSGVRVRLASPGIGTQAATGDFICAHGLLGPGDEPAVTCACSQVRRLR